MSRRGSWVWYLSVNWLNVRDPKLGLDLFHIKFNKDMQQSGNK